MEFLLHLVESVVVPGMGDKPDCCWRILPSGESYTIPISQMGVLICSINWDADVTRWIDGRAINKQIYELWKDHLW